MAAVAMWRANSNCPLSHKPEQTYVVQMVKGESTCAING
jgi:hypothetical protein